MINFTSEKCKQIALARLDIVHKWLEFRKHSQNKLQADYDFVKLHNTSNSHLFEILGKISRGSLHRWFALLNGTEDYTKLLPQYKYRSVDDYRTVLNDEEIKIFMGLLLHPNRLSIGKAIALTKYKLKEQGQSFIPADITFRRYAKWFKDNNYDKWILARDGEKALSDKVEPYIKRDASLLEVGDILVADGHKLAFQVINPFTGKPCRATLVGFLDWKSTALVGYEIMLEENTQCVASALRNSIINLDMIPKIVYQDNGRAFRAKYFTDDKGFTELGFYGLYAKLGIETVFAKPYNARAKVIERFFKEFQEGFEKLLPSYIGSNITNKPAYMMRNEKLYQVCKYNYINLLQGYSVESENLPEEWKLSTIGEYANIKSGFAFKSDWWQSTGCKVVKIGNIINNTIDCESCDCIEYTNAQKAGDFKINTGDLLIAMTGATTGKIGIVPNIDETLYVNQRVGKFFLGNNPFEKLPFLFCVLQSEDVNRQTHPNGETGSAQDNLSPDDIKNIKIVLPNDELVKQFNQSNKPLFEIVTNNNGEIIKLEKIKKLLLLKIS